MASPGPRVSDRSISISWSRDTGLRTPGLARYVLADGRTCLIWAAGSFFDLQDRLRIDDEISGWLAERLNAAHLPEITPRMNGCFAVVVVWPAEEAAEIALDRLAPIPLYAHVDSSSLIVSNDFWKVAGSRRSVEFDSDAVLSMAVAEYVVRPRTLLKDVSVLANAAVHRITWSGGVPRQASHVYWSLAFGAEEHRSTEVWRQGLAATLNRVFRRYGHAITARGWTACVPLSGGQDSRLSLGLLHRHGARVQAFSYGPSGNDESLIAAQVAEALGVPYRFVPVDDPSYLTPELIHAMARRVGMRARFTAGLGAQLSLRDYSPTDVFLPAHPGGLVPIGPESLVSFLVRTEEQAVQQLADNWFLPVFEEVGAALFPAIWRPDTKKRIVRSNWRFDPRDPLGSMQRWEWDNRHQMVLAELRTYELSGRWLLPTSDHEFIDFYNPVPAGLRYEKRLYTDTIIRNLLIDDLASLGKIRIAFSSGFEVPQESWKQSVSMAVPLGPLGDWLLRRATQRKLEEQRNTVGEIPGRVSGPEPIDYWWLTAPAFRASVIEMLENWDGMSGMIDVTALSSVLKAPMPRLFVRLGIPALLTLWAFQEIVENDLDPH